MSSDKHIVFRLRESTRVNEGRVTVHDLTKMNKNGKNVMIQGIVKRAVPGTKVWIDNNPPYTCKGNGIWEYSPEKHKERVDAVIFNLGFLASNGKKLYVEK